MASSASSPLSRLALLGLFRRVFWRGLSLSQIQTTALGVVRTGP